MQRLWGKSPGKRAKKTPYDGANCGLQPSSEVPDLRSDDAKDGSGCELKNSLFFMFWGERMQKTKIEYLTHTWNPIVGCEGLACVVAKVCWARKQARRQKNRCDLCYSFVPHVHFERFDQPLKVKKPSRIGVSFSGEFFSLQIPDWVRSQIMIRILNAKQHTFFILTKQPQNINIRQKVGILPRLDLAWLEEVYPSNLWIGVSVNVKRDLWRIADLKSVHAHKFISFEPLLEDLGEIISGVSALFEGIEWVIIGAQTKPKKLPSYSWVRRILNEARNHNVPVFMKNNVGWYAEIQEFPKT